MERGDHQQRDSRERQRGAGPESRRRVAQLDDMRSGVGLDHHEIIQRGDNERFFAVDVRPPTLMCS